MRQWNVCSEKEFNDRCNLVFERNKNIENDSFDRRHVEEITEPLQYNLFDRLSRTGFKFIWKKYRKLKKRDYCSKKELEDFYNRYYKKDRLKYYQDDTINDFIEDLQRFNITSGKVSDIDLLIIREKYNISDDVVLTNDDYIDISGEYIRRYFGSLTYYWFVVISAVCGVIGCILTVIQLLHIIK